jgi:hypothetical protein
MGLETGNTIAQLNAAWPLGSDPRSQGDDHLRLVKRVMTTDVVSRTAPELQFFASPLRVAGAIYIGADIAGVKESNLIAVSLAFLEFGVTGTGNTSLHYVFRDGAGTSVASVYGGGTASPANNTVITREKGDLRYAPKALLRQALKGLADTATVAELRDALIGALEA